MNSIAWAWQEPFWLRPRLSWYCPRYSHMRSFVFLPGPQAGGHPWQTALGPTHCWSGATPSPIIPLQRAENGTLAPNEPGTVGGGKKMSPHASGMLSDAGEGTEGEAEQKKGVLLGVCGQGCFQPCWGRAGGSHVSLGSGSIPHLQFLIFPACGAR